MIRIVSIVKTTFTSWSLNCLDIGLWKYIANYKINMESASNKELKQKV